jgi:predicted phosphodiesterase
MILAILSDIHANLEAFEAVVEDLNKQKPDKVICLGDLIGYGPDPEETVQLFRQKNYISILGNHEAALKGKKMRNWLNFQAKENSEQTENLLSLENIQFCRDLEVTASIHDMLFVHGFPPDSIRRYVTMVKRPELQSHFLTSAYRLCFVGHSHDLLLFEWNGKDVTQEKLCQKRYNLDKGRKYLINAGSVGQPRDGENSAKYLIFDTDTFTLEVFFVPYDYEKTVRKIEQRGFPEAYGLRLR